MLAVLLAFNITTLLHTHTQTGRCKMNDRSPTTTLSLLALALTPAERARLELADLDEAWCSRCEAHRNSVTGEYTLHLTITVRVSATTVRYAGTIIRKMQEAAHA